MASASSKRASFLRWKHSYRERRKARRASGGSMMIPSCTHRESSASFAASVVKTQAKWGMQNHQHRQWKPLPIKPMLLGGIVAPLFTAVVKVGGATLDLNGDKLPGRSSLTIYEFSLAVYSYVCLLRFSPD